MPWKIPGTVLTAPERDGALVEAQFRAMFLPGGISLSQVSAITGLDGYMIQNWVKRGFLTKPENKRYTLRQLCRIININMLRGALPIERICSLLGYVNGQLDDESDDMIDDAHLYFMFVRLATRSRELYLADNRDTVLDEELANYQEPVPGAKEKVKAVLRIMLTAWLATRMAQETENMLCALQTEIINEPERKD